MSITFRQIRYFISAVETGKLSAAAVQCGVSQSAVTLAVRDLEDRVGSPLLTRHKAGVALTADGHRFLLKARDIMAAVSEASRIHEQSESADTGHLRLGVTYTVMGYFIGPHVLRFKRRFPAVSLELVQMERSDLEDAVAEGAIDLAVMLVSNLSKRRGIATKRLLSSPRRLWLSPGHALLQQKSVTLADIARQPYIMLTVDEADHTSRRYWRKAGLAPNVILSTSSIEAVRSFVAGGLGVSILSDIVYRPWSLESDRIDQRNIDDPVPTMDIGIAWQSRQQPSSVTREFIHLLEASTTRSG